MELGLKGRRALVTGGALGIGQAIALDLAREGALVYIASRKADALQKTLDLLAGIAPGHAGSACEIERDGEPRQLVERVRADFGEPDILVNNVGHTQDVTDPYCPLSDWRRVFRLNFEVAVEMSNLVLPHMKAQDWGRIVNITAGSALENNGPVTYCASKAAITAYTRSMGRILALETSNVVMSGVMPGVVLTEGGYWDGVLRERPEHAEKYLQERTVLRRFGQPSEISPTVVMLCSEKASFCQGCIFLVDAGQARHFMYHAFMS